MKYDDLPPAVREAVERRADRIADYTVAQTLDWLDMSPPCARFDDVVATEGAAREQAWAGVLEHLSDPGCGRCVAELLVIAGDPAMDLYRAWLGEGVREEAVEERPLAEIHAQISATSMFPDILWALGADVPLDHVVRTLGTNHRTLAHEMARLRDGARTAVASIVARLGEGISARVEAAMTVKSPTPAPDLEILHAAAPSDAREFELPIEEPRSGEVIGTLDVVERRRDGGWTTTFVARVPATSETTRVTWRLEFERDDRLEWLRTHRAISRDELGALRLAAGEGAWPGVLDVLIPHRAGAFEDSDDDWSHTIDGRLPGVPRAWSVVPYDED